MLDNFRKKAGLFKSGLGMLTGGMSLESLMEFVEPFLTPENIATAKDKLVDFALSQQQEHGAPLMLSIELTGQQNDIALTIYKRNAQKPGGLERYHQFFLSQITPAALSALVLKFKNLQQQHGEQ